MNGPIGSFLHCYRAKKKTLLRLLTSLLPPKFCSIVSAYEWAVYAVLSNFTSTFFELEKKTQSKMSADQHTLNQGWKCPKYSTHKAQEFKIPHSQDDTSIKSHCPEQKHSQSCILPSALLSRINNRRWEALKSKDTIYGQEIILKESNSL